MLVAQQQGVHPSGTEQFFREAVERGVRIDGVVHMPVHVQIRKADLAPAARLLRLGNSDPGRVDEGRPHPAEGRKLMAEA